MIARFVYAALALVILASLAVADQPPQERSKKRMELLARCIEQLGPENADRCTRIVYGPSPRR